MKQNKNCIFCKIVRGEIPSYKIGENGKFLAILDIARFVDGHTIVIPKEHFASIWDVPDVGEYYEFIQKVGNHFRKLGFKYVDTLSVGRMILHAHVHLIPHNNEDAWRNSLLKIHEMQLDASRHPIPEEGARLVKKLKM